jgi:hypothetical protein
MASITTDQLLQPRHAYRGSCHCGLIKYIIYLRLPLPTAVPPSNSDAERLKALAGQDIYRCNCTTCHKMGIFHLRLADGPGDFAVLSPLLPDGSGLKMEEVGDQERGLRTYRCARKTQDWYFCGECGVRTFTIRGDFEPATVIFPVSLLDPNSVESGEKEVPIWRPKREGWKGSRPSYLSINATSLDVDQKGLDLRTLHKNGWVGYCEYLRETGQNDITPFEGGHY